MLNEMANQEVRTIFKLNGPTVAKKRTLHGYTQEKLGEETGLSRGTIQNIERQLVSGSVNELGQLARVFRCKYEELIEEEEHVENE